ncbi:MAG: magnesium chelatase subunit [Bacteroidetes bacterium]|jgi:Ca-activated chloride channel family protein|nr:magnesium chelatase subunit [Bacteroidota bacterium]
MKCSTLLVMASLAIIAAACNGPSSEEKISNTQVYYDMTPTAPCLDACAPPPPQNETEEAYSTITENQFRNSKSDPLSTFSIDVDAASYSNVRKKLMDGNLPPADAVRIEEFINYFSYNYPKPEGKEPFTIYTEYAECPWNSKHTLLQIGLKGKEIDAMNAAPNNLVFLLDVSGSMDEPDKLPLLKRAFKLMIPKLREEDRVSIVVYAGNAGLVLDGARGDQKEKIIEALEKLQAGGSTAGGQGISLAYATAKEHYIKNGNNRIILSTDGDFNVGISSVPELEKLITEKREEGIYLSVLGFGQGNLKDNTMETLADKGNGNYYFIDNILEARKVLVSQFGGTLTTIAKDVKIQVEFNPAKVKEYRLIGYENRMLAAEDFNDDKKDAGELGAGHCVTALYEIVPAGSAESRTNIDDLKYSGQPNTNTAPDLATVKFRYKGAKKNDTTSLYLQKVVYPLAAVKEKSSANMKLASAVSEFGMLLRDSKEKGDASFDEAIALASAAKANDAEGYVAGLIDMMKIAKDLKASSAPAPTE